jgi:hypothetical protein
MGFDHGQGDLALGMVLDSTSRLRTARVSCGHRHQQVWLSVRQRIAIGICQPETNAYLEVGFSTAVLRSSLAMMR